MLHCNMNQTIHLQLGLDDLLADLQHARRIGDLGRLAFVAYCEVRRWAREADEPAIAERASELITGHVPANKLRFLEQIDALIADLEDLQQSLPRVSSTYGARGQTQSGALA